MQARRLPAASFTTFIHETRTHHGNVWQEGMGEKVEAAMHEKKAGTLKSGRSGKTVTSRKQAIAIGLSEARKEGGKVPPRRRRRPRRPARRAPQRRRPRRRRRQRRRQRRNGRRRPPRRRRRRPRARARRATSASTARSNRSHANSFAAEGERRVGAARQARLHRGGEGEVLVDRVPEDRPVALPVRRFARGVRRAGTIIQLDVAQLAGCLGRDVEDVGVIALPQHEGGRERRNR